MILHSLFLKINPLLYGYTNPDIKKLSNQLSAIFKAFQPFRCSSKFDIQSTLLTRKDHIFPWKTVRKKRKKKGKERIHHTIPRGMRNQSHRRWEEKPCPTEVDYTRVAQVPSLRQLNYTATPANAYIGINASRFKGDTWKLGSELGHITRQELPCWTTSGFFSVFKVLFTFERELPIIHIAKAPGSGPFGRGFLGPTSNGQLAEQCPYSMSPCYLPDTYLAFWGVQEWQQRPPPAEEVVVVGQHQRPPVLVR